MKFLDLTDIDGVNKDLDFVTSDCRVIGGCELYTTKATGSDRRLFKAVTNDIESRFAASDRISASLSPPGEHLELMTRSSPFGPLDQQSSRRTFSYLLATLNASHPDYDFSSIVRPDHFQKERSLGTVMSRIDTALFNLRKPLPRMWDAIDVEMDLKACEIFFYDPANIEDPYFNDSLLWRFMYFFFNKKKKRVCYLHIRAISRGSHLQSRDAIKRRIPHRKYHGDTSLVDQSPINDNDDGGDDMLPEDAEDEILDNIFDDSDDDDDDDDYDDYDNDDGDDDGDADYPWSFGNRVSTRDPDIGGTEIGFLDTMDL